MANILCVDDSELGLAVRRLVLQSCGHTVVTACSAEQALSMFGLAWFDLVVTDYFLGDQTGAELAQEMKRRCPSVSVLMLSGAPELPESTAADAALVKGGDPRLLIEAVSELLEGREPVKSSAVCA